MIRKQRMIYGILILLVLSAIFPGTAFAAWQHEDRGTADFTKVLVGQDKKTYYINENVRTIFYSKDGASKIKPGNGRNKVRWSYLRIDDQTAGASRYGYCIEFGAGFSHRASYLARDPAKSHTLFHCLPKDTRKIIATILCYGRDGSKKVPVAGANDADYYFATQVLIWEAQQGLRTIKEINGKSKGTRLAAAHSMPAKHMYEFLKGRPAETCYRWILKRVNDHLTVHSFASETKAAAPVYTMNYDPSQEKWLLTLTDTNGKENGLKCTDPRVTVSRSGNKYTLEASQEIPSPLLLTGKNQMQGGSATGKILSWDCTSNAENQALLMGSKDMTSMYLNVQAPSLPAPPVPQPQEQTGVIHISKKGELPDLPTVSVTPDDTVTMGEMVTDGEAVIAGETVRTTPLAGVVFQIAAAEDIVGVDGTVSLKAGDVADTLTTDQHGNAASKALYPGIYQVTEIGTPEGYVTLSEPVRAEIIQEGQRTVVTPEEVCLTNTYQRGSVEIQKTDVSTDSPLPNTGIEILDDAKQVLLKDRTDKNGCVRFQKLPVGNYYFREFDAPKGYELDESLFPFVIKEHGEIVKCQMSNKKLAQETKPKDKREAQAPGGMRLEKAKAPQPSQTSRTSLDNSPQTGDDSHVLWICLICLFTSSGIIFAMIRIYKRY